MMSLNQLQDAVQQLSESDFQVFQHWFAEQASRKWDAQIAHDLESGRLQPLLAEIRADIAHGRVKPM